LSFQLEKVLSQRVVLLLYDDDDDDDDDEVVSYSEEADQRDWFV